MMIITYFAAHYISNFFYFFIFLKQKGFEFAADTAKSAVLALALRENAITANQATTVVRSAANNWLVLVRRKLDLVPHQ